MHAAPASPRSWQPHPHLHVASKLRGRTPHARPRQAYSTICEVIKLGEKPGPPTPTYTSVIARYLAVAGLGKIPDGAYTPYTHNT